jgi:hypothetical protein
MLSPRRLGLEWWKQGIVDEGLGFYGVNGQNRWRTREWKHVWKVVAISPFVMRWTCAKQTPTEEGMKLLRFHHPRLMSSSEREGRWWKSRFTPTIRKKNVNDLTHTHTCMQTQMKFQKFHSISEVFFFKVKNQFAWKFFIIRFEHGAKSWKSFWHDSANYGNLWCYSNPLRNNTKDNRIRPWKRGGAEKVCILGEAKQPPLSSECAHRGERGDIEAPWSASFFFVTLERIVGYSRWLFTIATQPSWTCE